MTRHTPQAELVTASSVLSLYLVCIDNITYCIVLQRSVCVLSSLIRSLCSLKTKLSFLHFLQSTMLLHFPHYIHIHSRAGITNSRELI